MLTTTQLEVLHRRALAAVRSAVSGDEHAGDGRAGDEGADDPSLLEPGAVFVTLRRHGRLRGCIGTLEAREPLLDAVDDRARAAALHDPRFDAVQPWELDDLDVEVSVLGPSEPMKVRSWSEAASAIRPGVDGVVVDDGHHRATFLPSVWDELPTPDDFLDRLWEKAGMVPRTWSERTQVSRYTVQHTEAAAPPDRTR